MVEFERLLAVIEQITAKMEALPERMGANMNACQGATEAEMKACREEVEAVAERREAPKEEAAVEAVGVLEDQHLAVGRRRQLSPGRIWPSCRSCTAQGTWL
jgi:hypothetical protein